jgi:XTP/dITP diphosphohydrolase
MNILIASGNKGKVAEISSFLSESGLSFSSISDLTIDEPLENGKTFEENAIIKAEYYSKITGMSCLSDDSGLVIPSINNKPGIYSARWAGPSKNFSLAIDKVYNELLHCGIDVNNDDIDAFFYCAIALKVPDKPVILCSGRYDGTLSHTPIGNNGFGYDPIFIPKHSKKTLGQYSFDEKNYDNHRIRALKKIKNKINSCKKDTEGVL